VWPVVAVSELANITHDIVIRPTVYVGELSFGFGDGLVSGHSTSHIVSCTFKNY